MEKYSTNKRYYGDFKVIGHEFIMEGFGLLGDENGYYTGFFKNNLKDGFGILDDHDEYYTGFFKNNLKDGFGILDLKCEDCYFRTRSSDLFETHNYCIKIEYKGIFKNDILGGYGIVEKKNITGHESIYKGEIKYRKRNGYGTLIKKKRNILNILILIILANLKMIKKMDMVN